MYCILVVFVFHCMLRQKQYGREDCFITGRYSCWVDSLCFGTKRHAFKLFCFIVCLATRSIESPGRHVHSYPGIIMGPSSRNRRNAHCSVSDTGDIVRISPASIQAAHCFYSVFLTMDPSSRLRSNNRVIYA